MPKRALKALMLLLPGGVLWAASWSTFARAEERSRGDLQRPPPIEVVVFDFDVRDPAGKDLGRKIANVVGARFLSEGSFQVVWGETLRSELEERRFELPGAAGRVEAVEAGYLLGAQLAVFGRAFEHDGASYLIAKAIGTGDGSIAGVIVKRGPDEASADFLDRAAHDLVDVVQGRRLRTPRPLSPSRAKLLEYMRREGLSGIELPRVAVIISEKHLGQQLPQPISETEVAAMLADAGVDAYACGTPASRQWAKGLFEEAAEELPPETRSADLILAGYAWSSPTDRHGTFGTLRLCEARIQVKVMDRATGRELQLQIASGRSLDEKEDAAGRRALERASQRLARRVVPAIQEWVRQQRPAEEKQDGGE